MRQRYQISDKQTVGYSRLQRVSIPFHHVCRIVPIKYFQFVYYILGVYLLILFPLNVYFSGCESETDTEEFEKVGDGISAVTPKPESSEIATSTHQIETVSAETLTEVRFSINLNVQSI